VFFKGDIMKRKKSCWECSYFFYGGSGNEGDCENPESEHYADRIHQDRSCDGFSPIHGNTEDFYDDDEN
jgi:hypothetical protein